MGAWGCSRALWPSRVGEGVGGGKRARGLRVCLGGPPYQPDAASAFLRRSPPPRRPRPRLGQRCPGAPRSNLHTAAPPGLFHAGAVGGWYGEGVVEAKLIAHTAHKWTPRPGEEFELSVWGTFSADLRHRQNQNGWKEFQTVTAQPWRPSTKLSRLVRSPKTLITDTKP